MGPARAARDIVATDARHTHAAPKPTAAAPVAPVTALATAQAVAMPTVATTAVAVVTAPATQGIVAAAAMATVISIMGSYTLQVPGSLPGMWGVIAVVENIRLPTGSCQYAAADLPRCRHS